MAKRSIFKNFFSRTKKETDSTAEKTPRHETPALKLVFFICDWQNAHIVSDVCVEEKVRFHFTCLARGTASSEILDLLGIGASEKAVISCLEQEVGVMVLMKEVRKKLRNSGPGAGIAFTIPLSAINDPILLIFKQSILKNEKITENPKGEGNNMANKYSHDLIVSIVNQGYSDELMDTARAAGATGGTVINTRGTAHQGAVKFFGISVQDEKEMIFILADQEKKVPIMKAICETHGLNSKARGIVFSLPVDNVVGLSHE